MCSSINASFHPPRTKNTLPASQMLDQGPALTSFDPVTVPACASNPASANRATIPAAWSFPELPGGCRLELDQ